MTGLVFVLVLLGCNDAGEQCQNVAESGAYRTRQACEADKEQLLDSEIARRVDHPTVSAQCVARSLQQSRSPQHRPQPV